MEVALIIIGIIIFIIVVIASNAKKNSKQQTQPANPTNNIRRKEKFQGNYLPKQIQATGIQVLESSYIVGTSKAIDTVKARFDFLLNVIPTLKKWQNNSRYLSDIQVSVDTYKTMYYDRIPQDYQLSIIANPIGFDLTDFYCKALFSSFK